MNFFVTCVNYSVTMNIVVLILSSIIATPMQSYVAYSPYGYNGYNIYNDIEDNGPAAWPTLNFPAYYNLQKNSGSTRVQITKSPPDPLAAQWTKPLTAEQSLERMVLGNAPPEEPDSPAEVVTMPPEVIPT